jgi:molybdopterin-biosynthesis enzyme MoeA-like protein
VLDGLDLDSTSLARLARHGMMVYGANEDEDDVMTLQAPLEDDEADIAATCLSLRQRVGPGGLVFSSGGIGPTHDDKTYESIARALGLGLALHHPTVERMQEHYSARGLELVGWRSWPAAGAVAARAQRLAPSRAAALPAHCT